MAFFGSLEVGQQVGLERRAARRKLRLVHELGSGAEVVIHDLSTTGLLIETSAELFRGDIFEVELAEAGATRVTVVWNSGRFFGCQFEEAIPGRAVSAALLRSPNSPPPSDPRQTLYDAEGQVEEKPPLPTRLRIIVVLSLAAWLIVGLALWIGTVITGR